MKENKVCQLYKYDRDFYLKTVNNPAHFASEFVNSEVNLEMNSWLNFHDINCKEEISKLFNNLQINDLVLEGVYEKTQRPKIEEYGNYIFFNVRSALPSKNKSDSLLQEQISFVLGKNYLISLQEKSSDHFTEVRERIEIPKGLLRSKGVDFLLFRLLEAIVDNYYEVLDEIVNNAADLEVQVLNKSNTQTLQLIENEKKRLGDLRRIAIPMRNISSQIQKSSNPLFESENGGYFANLKDHCSGVLDEIDTTKQILDGLINLYFAVQGQRMNEVMKLLTVTSAIFIPLTFLAGIYGMNFTNMPELSTKYGYFILLGLMLTIAVSLVFYFKRKGWMK